MIFLPCTTVTPNCHRSQDLQCCRISWPSPYPKASKMSPNDPKANGHGAYSQNLTARRPMGASRIRGSPYHRGTRSRRFVGHVPFDSVCAHLDTLLTRPPCFQAGKAGRPTYRRSYEALKILFSGRADCQTLEDTHLESPLAQSAGLH